jgi:hypothetical protein
VLPANPEGANAKGSVHAVGFDNPPAQRSLRLGTKLKKSQLYNALTPSAVTLSAALKI